MLEPLGWTPSTRDIGAALCGEPKHTNMQKTEPISGAQVPEIFIKWKTYGANQHCGIKYFLLYAFAPGFFLLKINPQPLEPAWRMSCCFHWEQTCGVSLARALPLLWVAVAHDGLGLVFWFCHQDPTAQSPTARSGELQCPGLTAPLPNIVVPAPDWKGSPRPPNPVPFIHPITAPACFAVCPGTSVWDLAH